MKESDEAKKEEYMDNKDELREKIANYVLEALDRKDKTQKVLAEYIGIDESSVSRSLRAERDFNVYELKCISEFLDVSIEEIMTGVAPENQVEHTQTGLSNYSINWLKSAKDKKPYLFEIVNLILGNEEIADAMFESIYLYAVSSIPPTYFKKEGTVTERQARTLADDDLLLRYAIVGSFEEILKLIKKEYERIPKNYNKRMQEEKLHSIYESLRQNLQRVSDKSYEIDVENAEEILDFDKEAEEYNKN
mgnify:CR=1 FL=1